MRVFEGKRHRIAAIANGTIIIAYASVGGSLRAQEVNLREACRKAVAGAMLEAHDRHVQASQYVALLEEAVAAKKSAQGPSRRAVETTKAAAEQQSYDVGLAAQRDSAENQAAALADDLSADLKLLANAKKAVLKAAENEKKLRARIEPVFVVENRGAPVGAYPMHIDYRKEARCTRDANPYVYLCALPPKLATKLRRLVAETKTPSLQEDDPLATAKTPCEHYANFSR